MLILQRAKNAIVKPEQAVVLDAKLSEHAALGEDDGHREADGRIFRQASESQTLIPAMKRLSACLLSAFIFTVALHGGDAEILASLKSKGAELTETKGVVTGLSIPDCSKLTPADYAQIRQLTAVKLLSFGKGFDDAGLQAIGAATAVETLSTNGMDASDEGVRALAMWKGLRTVSFFHPGKRLTGTGLAALAAVPTLERLTVAGSMTFADDGMAAVATLTQLRNFRTWHSGVTPEGVKKLAALKNLTSIHLGQRLSYTPPVTLSDAALPILAELPLLGDVTLAEARLTLGALSQLKKLTALKRLTLDGIEISESDIAALKQQLPKVDLRWTPPNAVYKKRIDALFK